MQTLQMTDTTKSNRVVAHIELSHTLKSHHVAHAIADGQKTQVFLNDIYTKVID